MERRRRIGNFVKRVLAGAAFVVAAAFFWGTTEAILDYFWAPWGTWWGERVLASAFARSVFYLVAVAAAAIVATACAAALRLRAKGRRPNSGRRWAGAAATAAVFASNAGWLIIGLAPKNQIKIASLLLDTKKPGPFFIYWAFFIAAGVALAVLLGVKITPRRWWRRAGAYARAFGVVGFAVVTVIHFLAPVVRPVPRGPNILLITLDAWRADAFRPAVMPKLSAFARENAVVYRRAWTCAPWTLPAVAALFVSDYPYAYRSWVRPREEGHVKLARALRDAGYDTGALVGNATLDYGTAFAEGFDHFTFWDWSPVLRAIRYYNTNWYCEALRDALHLRRPLESDTSAALTSRARDFISAPRRRPYFLWVHYLDPHWPYAPPAGYYAPADEKFMKEDSYRLKERVGPQHRLYEGECAHLDDLLTPLFARARAAGPTVIILTTDHGEEFWEHKTYGHGVSVYEPVVRVPLIVAVPGEKPGECFEPVSHLDVAPTIIRIAGVPAPKTMVGAPLPSPTAPPARKFIFVGSGFTARPDYNPPPEDAVILWPWKLILTHDAMDAPGEYYNLEDDPGEQHPLPEDARAALLRQKLKNWKAALESNRSGATTPLEAVDAADLKALGYIR